MKAAVLVRKGKASQAFEIQERNAPEPSPTQVRLDVEVFGLNYADVMARLGKYQDAPPMPSILGYEAVGRINKIGSQVTGLEVGQRVLAFTRFGAYASQAVTEAMAVVPISDDLDAGIATAFGTQYCTAFYAANYVTQLHAGEHVLVQSAAGGVGTALVQFALHKGCIVYGTAGSEKKLDYLRALGVQYPINYTTEDFEEVVKKHAPNGKIDAMFDAVGGSAVKKGFRILAGGGRLVCYGASSMSQQGLFGTVGSALGFGFYHPAQLMIPARSILGVNMLRIADEKPQVMQYCMQEVIKLYEQGIFVPSIDKVYPVSELATAHEALEMRKTIGKVAVKW